MGWAAKANRFSLQAAGIKKQIRETEHEQRIKVHIPNSTLSVADGIFMSMLKGLRPATPSEHLEMKNLGMDLRPPDIVIAEKKREALESTKPKTRQPEVRLIKLTDED